MHVKLQIAQLDEFALRGTTGLIRLTANGARKIKRSALSQTVRTFSPRCSYFVAIGQRSGTQPDSKPDDGANDAADKPPIALFWLASISAIFFLFVVYNPVSHTISPLWN